MKKAELKYLYESVGNQIKELRRKAGFSQDELATKLNKSRVSIVNIEKGRQRPSLHLLIELSMVFNVKLDEFVPINYNNGKSEERKLNSQIAKAVQQTSETTGENIEAEPIAKFIKGLTS